MGGSKLRPHSLASYRAVLMGGSRPRLLPYLGQFRLSLGCKSQDGEEVVQKVFLLCRRDHVVVCDVLRNLRRQAIAASLNEVHLFDDAEMWKEKIRDPFVMSTGKPMVESCKAVLVHGIFDIVLWELFEGNEHCVLEGGWCIVGGDRR